MIRMLELSPLDHGRFGFPVAKGIVREQITGHAVAESARNLGARLAIVRVPANFLESVHSLEAGGALLCDTLVYFRREIDLPPASQIAIGYLYSAATPNDADESESLARIAFSGYFNHYHADPRIDSAVRDEIYPSWARRICLDTNAASHVLIVRSAIGELIAFLAIKSHPQGRLEIVLNGVSPKHRGKGLYGFLIDEAQRWGQRQCGSELSISTQITNIGVQRIWCRAGFEPFEYFYTFHIWLDD